MEKIINVTDLTIGLKLSKPVYMENTKVVLVNKDVMLDLNIINMLKSLKITYVFVYGEDETQKPEPPVHIEESPNLATFPPVKQLKLSKILIVDDERDICMYIKDVLENSNYETVTALSAKEAWGYLINDPDINMVFLDIMMPETNGFELLKKIKGELGRPLNVVMVTARKTMQDVIMAKELGVAGYITKPFDPERLVKIAELALAESKNI